MQNFYKYFVLIVLSLVCLQGCEQNPSGPDYQKEVTIFGYLWGNEYLTAEHAILVAYTRPITEFYRLEDAGIQDAQVTLTNLNTGQVTILEDSVVRPGFYFNDRLLILPETSYRLEVRADGRLVTATTTVPANLKVTTRLRQDSVNAVYVENLSREMPVFIESSSPDQIVLVDLFCDESYTNAEYINPFNEKRKFPESQEEYDGGSNGEPRHIMGSARLKEFISPQYPGQYVIYWYSSMVVFYGAYTMQVTAIDGNYHRFLYQEHPEYSGGVQGGLGVLGSVCGATFKLKILKP
ncbi:carboxypeptidase-like regulatory domain-containing protein [candidate division KSB1 bacterium]|nr:carboxypeptidase-like regulatory domain-containing protein [candidate division KSB1 bacterium]